MRTGATFFSVSDAVELISSVWPSARRVGDVIGADVAARAGLVLDDHLLLPERAQLRRHEARERVGAAAGRERARRS